VRTRRGWLSLDELSLLVADGSIDTVVLAFADMQGRLQGKRLAATFFLDHAAEHATEACNYLLAVDADMTPASGYEMTSWEQGYGDFVLRPDLATLRRIPWQVGSALCIADVEWEDGSPVRASPRHILRHQVQRLAEHGWHGLAGTELEFIVFRESYETAWRTGYRRLTPANLYNVDYSILGTGRVEPLLSRIRSEMAGAGMNVESSKGECNLGQHEITFLYSGLVQKADEHSIYKTGAKEIAAQERCSLTFMAKYDAREGNSCHIHLSLRDDDDRPVFAGDQPGGWSPVFENFLAGLLASAGELTLLFAPNVNSYKRYREGSFAPTGIAWGRDNRTCAFRVVGHGPSLRIEVRVPGGDVNPYLAIAALVAGGLQGVERSLELEPPFTGNAYAADLPRIPMSLDRAARLFDESELARSAFGDDVVEHYLNMARVELDTFSKAVTDWERYRCFERM
jgi:glutamine synthetase